MFGLPDLLCPEFCAGCRRMARGGLCLECLASLPRIGSDVCSYCGRPSCPPVHRCRDCRDRELHFDLARQAVTFGSVTRTVIHRFKYSGSRSLGRPLAALIAELAFEVQLNADAVTWVAPSSDRMRRTGVDHGKVLATLVAATLNLPAAAMVDRVRRAAPQMKLDPQARRRNLAGAFRASIPPPARVLVVDDVFTTGSTASEMARALKAAGCREVVVLSAARSFA